MNVHLTKTHLLIGACLFLSTPNLLAQNRSSQSSGSDALIINQAGNVGIGIQEPLTRLHVAGPGEVELSLQSQADRGRRFTLQSGPIGVDFKVQFQIVDRNAGVCRFGIDSNGNVGINNRNPEKTLDVNGEIKASGTITAPTFKGNVEGTTMTAQTFKGNVEGTTMTAQTFKGNVDATTVTASNSINATNLVSTKALRADGGTMLFTGGTKEGSTNVVLHRNENDAYIYPFGTGTKSNMLVVGGGLTQNNTGFIVTGPTQLRSGVVVGQESLFEGFVEINGSRNTRPPKFRHFSVQTYNGDGFLGKDPTDSWPVSLKARNVVMGSDFFAFSDARIKKDLKQSDAAKDLGMLKRLQVTDYKYIDVMNRGTHAKKGFIAQQVEGVFPEAVRRGSDFIPNIYAAPEQLSATGNNVIITMAKPHQLTDGDEVRIYTSAGEQEKTIRVVSANSFSVEGSLPDYAESFVFGKKVDDFRTVDYDRLFTLNVSATQELARKVETLEREQEQMKNAYEELSKKMARLEAMISGTNNNAAVTAAK